MLTNQIRAWLSGEGEGEEEGGILEVMVPSVFNKRMGQKSRKRGYGPPVFYWSN